MVYVMSYEFKVVIRDVRLSYDVESDTLYVDFEPNVEAEETMLVGENVVLRIKEGRLLGLTIMNFSRLSGFSTSEF